MSARFGTAGNSAIFTETVSKSSLKAPEWLHTLGLECYEYQCGKGVHVGEQTALALGREGKRWDIAMSLHAPYFINLANPDTDALNKTIGYITGACRIASLIGATRVVVHPGGVMKRTRREAMQIAKQSLKEVLAACDGQGYGQIALCPETMGKINQVGALEEVLELCGLDERLIPCIDFGHLYARSLGADEGAERCDQILTDLERALGPERSSRFHSHFSHIEFTPNGGEKRHLTFSDGRFGPDFTPLAHAIASRNWHPTVICESAGTQAEDALEMQRIYRQITREEAANT